MPVKINKHLLFILVTVLAFWQLAFLQNGMKWDFTDAFLPSRYFFSESILNNQFPLWNPYLLYGTPIYADLVSVFNPEFWIIGNMFGYNNIVLQFMFLVYVYLSGVSFSFLLKQFNTDKNLSLALSVSYMLSGFVIGNAQHLAFVAGYALIPFLSAAYYKFLRKHNKANFILLAIALYLMIFCSYPAITIISGYLLFTLFLFYLIRNIRNKQYLIQLISSHLYLIGVVIVFAAVLMVAYFQAQPFLNRYAGVSADLAQKHAFTWQSFLSFLFPMSTGVKSNFFATDISMRNAYFGIFSLVLLVFSLIIKKKNSVSYIFLIFAIFSLLASLGKQFFLRGLLYNYAPFLNMFQYPALFRAFTIFGFLAFIGINFRITDLNREKRNVLAIIISAFIMVLIAFVIRAQMQINEFIFFNWQISFNERLANAGLHENIVLQGILQIILLMFFLISILNIKNRRNISALLLLFFVFDGIVSSRLNMHYTVINNDNPFEFAGYLKASPKGFPLPDLKPIEENSDKNASNRFVWMNNNVFPKLVTFDGKVAFKLNGYGHLADNYPTLLDSVKKNPILYFSHDVRNSEKIVDFTSKTVYLSSDDVKGFYKKPLKTHKFDEYNIIDFAPTKIVVETSTVYPQFLVYQQNYFKGWKTYIDGKEQKIHPGNFTHMAVLVPKGKHEVIFEYKNPVILVLYALSVLIFVALLTIYFRLFIIKNPEQKKQIQRILWLLLLFFMATSISNRIIYKRNKKGLTNEIAEFTKLWKSKYKSNISVFLSSSDKQLHQVTDPNALAFLNEGRNLDEFSSFLMNEQAENCVLAWSNGAPGNLALELFSSFYPEKLETKRNNNSGMILAKRNDKMLDYYYEENFEIPRENNLFWENSRIESDPLTGNHSFRFSENDVWGSTIKFLVDNELKNLKQLTVFADIKMKNIKEALLVVSIEREKDILLYEVSKMNHFIKNSDDWHRAVFSQSINFELHKNDVIKIYFWNKSKAHFNVDNLKLKFNFQ